MSFQSEANSTYVNGSPVAKSDVRALWGDVDDVVTTLNRLGVIPLTNIGGTANAITADMASGTPVASLNANSTVSFTPSASNTGSPVTLFVAGDQARPLRGEDGGDIPAGYLKASRFYIAQRFGANWKIISGGATYDDLTTISSTIAAALNVVGVVPLINVAGTGDAITADMAVNAVNAGMALGGNALVEFIPAATNANPSPTLLISQDGTARNIQPEDGGAMPANYLVPGRSYFLRRRGSVWRVVAGAITKLVLDQLENRTRNNFRDSGLIQLVSIGGTADDVTANISASGLALGVSVGSLSTVKFTAASTNTGAMTLTVAGDETRPLLGNNGNPLESGDVRFGWSYICRRAGDNWRIESGGVALRDVQVAESRVETRRAQDTSSTGILSLANVGGTANNITADLLSPAWMEGIGITERSWVVLIAPGTNTEPVTLTVSGDETRAVLRDNGQPLEPGDLLNGRTYLLRRRSGNWHVANLGVTPDRLGTAAYAALANIIDNTKMTQAALINLTTTGSGNAIQASIHASLPQVTISNTGVLRFSAPGTNTAPNPTITIGGVTRTIYDADGSELPAGAIRYQKMYLLRIMSASVARIINGPGFSDLPTSASFTEIWDAINGKASSVSVAALEAAMAGKADQSALDALETVVEGLLAGTHLVGDWDASTGAFPTARPDASDVQAGDQFNVVGAGTVDGIDWAEGDILTALVDDPGATYAGHWTRRAGTATIAAQVATTRVGKSVQDALDAMPAFKVWDFYEPTDSGFQMAFNRACEAASLVGAGAVLVEPRALEYAVTGPVTLRSRVDMVNIGTTKIRLADGVGSNVVESLGWREAMLSGFEDRDYETEYIKVLGGLWVDGNRAGNPTPMDGQSGNGFAIFGREFVLEDLKCHNTRMAGCLSHYHAGNLGGSPYGGKIERLEVMSCGTNGWINGCSDLMADKINALDCSLNEDATHAAIRAVRGFRAGSITVWRRGHTSYSHSYAIEMINGGLMAPVLSLETGALGQVYLAGACDITCHSYNMIGAGRPHFTVAGPLASIRGRISGGSVGAPDSIAVLIPEGATVRNCLVDLHLSGIFGHVLKIDGSSAGDNEFRFRNHSNGNFPVITGSLHATDELFYKQAGGLERSMHKKPAASSAVVAAGTTQVSAIASSGALLRHQVNRVTSANEANIAVALPGWLIGLELRVTNLSPREIVIYPQVGDAFVGQAANAGWAVPPHRSVSVLCEDAGLWSVVG